jgi:hypothetical protein
MQTVPRAARARIVRSQSAVQLYPSSSQLTVYSIAIGRGLWLNTEAVRCSGQREDACRVCVPECHQDKQHPCAVQDHSDWRRKVGRELEPCLLTQAAASASVPRGPEEPASGNLKQRSQPVTPSRHWQPWPLQSIGTPSLRTRLGLGGC